MIKLFISLGVGVAIWTFPVFLIYPNLSGHWQGKGTAQDNKGWKTSCEELSYTFLQTPTSLNVLGGHTLCGSHQRQFESVILDIKDGQLFYDDIYLGTITENQMSIVYQDEDISLYYSFTKNLDHTLNYSETQYNGEDFLKIEGLLQ